MSLPSGDKTLSRVAVRLGCLPLLLSCDLPDFKLAASDPSARTPTALVLVVVTTARDLWSFSDTLGPGGVEEDTSEESGCVHVSEPSIPSGAIGTFGMG